MRLEKGEKVEVGGHAVRQLQSGPGKPYCLHRDAVPALAEQLGISLTGELPDKTRDDLSLKKELPAALKIAPRNPLYVAWRTATEERLAKGERVEVGGYAIQKMQSGAKTAYCLHRKAVPALADNLHIQLSGDLPTKTTDDLALGAELPQALNISPVNQRYADWRTQTEERLARGERVEVGGYAVRQMQAHTMKPYCLHRDALPALAKQLEIKLTGELPKKTTNDLTLSKELPLALKMGKDNSRYVAWRTQTEERLAKGERVEVGGYAVRQMQAHTMKPYCLHRDALIALKQTLADLEMQEAQQQDAASKREHLKSSRPKPRDRTGRGSKEGGQGSSPARG